MLDFCCHHPHFHHYPCECWDCRAQSSGSVLICIMQRIVLMLSGDKLAEVSCSTEKWSADVTLSNLKNGNMVTGRGKNVHASLLANVSCLLPGVFHLLLTTSTDSNTFFSSCKCECLLVCVCPGWPTEVFPLHFQLHASLSPRVLLLAARAKGNSWVSKEQHTKCYASSLEGKL